jgi:RNA polymerase sigma-70 factor (ECF subfamily)
VTAELDAAVEMAQELWPKLKVNPAAFRKQLAAAGEASYSHAADLYLALACADQDAPAVKELVKRVKAEVPRALRHLGQGADFAEDIGQRLLTKLLVGEKNEPAKISTYAARGPLIAWVRAAAVRTALNALEATKPQLSVSRSIPGPSRGAGDPELALIRRQYGGALKAAVEAALRNLEPDDRNVLRFYFVDSLTVDQIARIRGSHKSTVSRLITRIRKDLLAHVEGELVGALKARPEELSSVLRALVSQLDVSIESALAVSQRRP